MAEMRPISFLGVHSLNPHSAVRVSTPQPVCLHCSHSARSCLSLASFPLNHCQHNGSEGSLDCVLSNQLPARKKKFNVFSHLEDIKGNVNSNNKPSETPNYSTSELESSEEEMRPLARKNFTTRSNFRRMSSAAIKKPQLKSKEDFVSCSIKTSKGLSNNVNYNAEDYSRDDKRTKKGTKPIKEEDKTELKQKEVRNVNEGELNAQETNVGDDYLQTLVGGDTMRPVELKHYNSNEFIGQMLKMRGGWRFNISFSELQGEGGIEELNESETGIAKPKTPEQKVVKGNKQPPEFCSGTFKDTFEEFVSRWKDNQLDNTIFKESQSEEKEISPDAEFEVTCKPKSRKARFSRYHSIPKKFGECEINLFYSPRRCQL